MIGDTVSWTGVAGAAVLGLLLLVAVAHRAAAAGLAAGTPLPLCTKGFGRRAGRLPAPSPGPGWSPGGEGGPGE